jgi:hypothetical protein
MKMEARSTGGLGSCEKKLRDCFSTKESLRMCPPPGLLYRGIPLTANAGRVSCKEFYAAASRSLIVAE